MSGADTSQGPGWWQASDGKWYPPEQKPGGAPASTPTPTPSPTPTPTPTPSAGPAPIPSSPLQAANPEGRSFFARLFDTSFSSFITPSIIKLLFILGVIFFSIIGVVLLIAGLATLDDNGIVLVILAPIYWFFGVVYTRVFLELAIVFFRIESNTRKT